MARSHGLRFPAKKPCKWAPYAAISQIDRGRHLRRPRDADQDHIGFLEIVGHLPIVVHHRVVERIDAAEIFGVQRVLRTDLVGRSKYYNKIL